MFPTAWPTTARFSTTGRNQKGARNAGGLGGGDTAGRGQPHAPTFHLNQCSLGSPQAQIHTGVESGPSDQAQRETGRQRLKEARAWENAAGARPGDKGGQVSTAAGALPEACCAGERLSV